MQDTLLNRLREHSCASIYPMHMPGHKRNAAMLGGDFPLSIDNTEIDGLIDLSADMRRAARLYDAKRAFYLVNGSTVGILAGIRACTRRGDRVLVARNSHISVYHALELNALNPVYLTPAADESFDLCGSIAPHQVERALEQYHDIRLAIITSPTYEGVISDIPAIAKALHARGIPLLVDAAHGAHLGLSSEFPENACGADLTVLSLHKTLFSMTQTGLLLLHGERINPADVQRELNVFQTTSPSYVLMASIDECVRKLEADGSALFYAYRQRLHSFSEEMQSLKRLRVLCHGLDIPASHPTIFAHDPGKIVIDANGVGMTGAELNGVLRSHYGVEMEMALGDLSLGMTSVCDTDDGFRRFSAALLEIDRIHTQRGARVEPPPPLPPAPECAMRIDEALDRRGALVPLEEAQNHVCREYVYAYPPGVPVLTPGQIINGEALAYIRAHPGVRCMASGRLEVIDD